MGYFIRWFVTALAMLSALSHHLYAQSKLCTGILGDPIILKDFGTGTTPYNNTVTGSEDYGFYTSFDFRNRAGTNDGMYSFVNRIPADFTIQNTNVWLSGEDHTPNDVGGYMMLVNADASRGEFYKDTVTGLCTGGTYEFSSYLANIFKPSAAFPNGLNSIAPRVKFEIRNMAGVVLDSINTGNIPNSAALNWQKYGITFTSPATSVVLVMISVSNQGIGNDIVLDDIAFRPCTPATISITPTIHVCEGGSGTFTVRVEGNADYKYSRWQSSTDGIVWNYVGSTIVQTTNSLNYTVDLPLTNLVFSDDSTTYRLILSTNEANLADITSRCNVISPSSLLRVYQYPILQVTDPAPVCNTKVDLTAAAVTAGSTLRSGTISYYTSLSNAQAGTNAIGINQAKELSTSGQYFIKAATNTTPSCSVVSPVSVTIASPRTLQLSQPLPLCKSNATFTITATTVGINDLIWTKYAGAVADVLSSGAAKTLSIVPTAVDLAEDSLWIKVVSADDASICPNVKDSVMVILVQEPQITLPADTQICKDSELHRFKIPMSILNTQNTTLFAKLGTLTKLSADTLLYSFGADIKAITLDSVAVTVANAPCPSRTDYRIIRYIPIPTLTTQIDTTACSNSPDFLLKASSLHTASLQWTASKAGTFDDANAVRTWFHPAAAHSDTIQFFIEAGSVFCGTLKDTVLYIYERPVHLTASHTVSCISDRSTTLSGDITDGLQNNLSSMWSTSGTGIFSGPNTTAANVYVPSALDMSTGFVDLTYKSVAQKICPNKDTTMRYRIVPLPLANAGPDTSLCAGAIFSRAINNNVNFKQEWSSFSGGIFKDSISLANSVSIVANADHQVFLTLRNSIGCLSRDSFEIKVYAPPAIVLPAHLCFSSGLSLLPTVSFTPTSGSYVWFKDQNVLNSGNNLSNLAVAAVGKYTLQYINGDCKSQASTLVTPVPLVDLTDQISCIGASVTIKGPKYPKLTYYWNGLSGTSIDSLVVVTSAQTETIRLEVADTLGCRNRDSAQVEGVPYPQFDLKSADVCMGETGRIITTMQDPNLANHPNFKHQWAIDGKHISVAIWQGADFNASGIYALDLSIGACKVVHDLKVQVNPLPIIQLQDKYIYCNETQTSLKISANEHHRHVWYEGNTVIGNAASLEVSPQVATAYRLEAETEYGCKFSKPVSVDICCPPRLFVPNVITPFSKDQNALLNIFGANFTDFEMTVFNRWGEIIYETKDPAAPWDGNYRNEEMPIGVYPWIISYNAVCPEYRGDYKLKGDVTIVK